MNENTSLSFSIDPSGAKTGSTQVVRSLEDIKNRARESAGQFNAFEAAMKRASEVGVRSLQYLGAGFAGMKIASLIKQTIELGARYEELGIGLTRVGANVGETAKQINSLEVALKRTGISANQSRQSIMSMIQANMDLTQATKLARVAQDAAVVGQVNSSDALQRIIYGLQTAQPEMLRTLGLTVNFEQAYAKMAKTLNVSQNALSEEQKAQARLNAVMEAGGKITGLYEASMTSASKIMRSTTRYVEDLQVKLGGLFQPAYGAAVNAYSETLKAMAKNTDLVIAGVVGLSLAFSSKKIVSLLAQAADGARRFKESFTEKGKAEMGAYAEAAAKATFRTLQQAVAEETLAKSALRTAQVERESAKTRDEKAKATLRLFAAETAAIEAERVATVARIQAQAAIRGVTAATVEATIAQRAMTAAWAAGSKVVEFFGGPIGIAITALATVMTKLSMTQRSATQYITDNADSMQLYMDKVKGVKDSVENLSAAEQKRAAQRRRQKGEELQAELSEAQGGIGKTRGGGFWGTIASSFDEASPSIAFNKAVYDVQKLNAAFANDKDIKKYQQGLSNVREAMGPLTKSQREYFNALQDGADEVEALTMASDAFLGRIPALTEEVKKAGDAFKMSSTQIEAFEEQLKKTNDSQARLALAQKIGKDNADLHAKAAANLGMSIGDFEKALNGSVSASQAAAKGQLDLVAKSVAADKAYEKLGASAKKTKEEVDKFVRSLAAQLSTANGTRDASDELADQFADLSAQAEKMGSKAKAAFASFKASMESVFAQKEQKKIFEATQAFDALVREQEQSAVAAEKLAAAQLKGRDAVDDLAVQEAGLNALRGKSLNAMQAVTVAATAMSAERRKQAVQAAQDYATSNTSIKEQIAGMNAEADAYEKGGQAVKDYTFKLKVLELIRNGSAKTATEAFDLAKQWQEAMDRLDKTKNKVDTVKEAMLEATRGIQRSISGLISDAFSGSLKDARDYGQQLIGIFRDIAAQIVAAFAFKKLGINKILEEIGSGQGKFSEFIKNGGMLSKAGGLAQGIGGGLVGGAVGYAVGGMANSNAMAGFGGAASGAAAGAMVGGPIGAVVGGAAGLVGGLLGYSKKLREEQKLVEEATRQFKRSMQNFVEAFIAPVSDFEKAMRGIGESALALAQEAAKKYKGISVGTTDTKLTPDQLFSMAQKADQMAADAKGSKKLDLARYAADLRAIYVNTTEAVKKLAEEQQKLETGYNRELAARAAMAEGRTGEAEDIRRQMQNQQELDDARKKGFTETTIRELERVQALEASAAALERAKQAEKERADFQTTYWERFASVTGRTDIAATVQADNQRTADRTMADDMLKRGVISQEMYDQFVELIGKAFNQALADRAQEYQNRTQDLGVRMQTASGNTRGAEDLAFRLSQEREMRDALKDTSKEGIAYANTLKEVQAAETAAREAAKAQQRADANADLSVRSLVAQGKSEEAEAAAFALQQQKEMREALKDTTAEGVAYAASLKTVQEAEAAAREAAKQRAAVENAQSVEARILRAQGRSYDADTIAIQISRSKELEAATSDELKARLQLLYSIEDEERARQLAKSNQMDFNTMMVETLQLQGRAREAAELEFNYKQASFREELDSKLLNKQITQDTYDLGIRLIGLRRTAFEASLASSQQGAAPTAETADVREEKYSVLGGQTVLMGGVQTITEVSAASLVSYASVQVTLLRRLVAAVEGGASMASETTAVSSTTQTNRELGYRADTTAILVSGVIV